MKIIGKFWRLLRDEGAGTAVLRAVHYLTPNWLFFAHSGYLVRNDLDVLPAYEGTETVRWASARDLHELRRFDDYCDDLPGWIERGDRFVVAVREGRVVGFENYQAHLHWLVPERGVGIELAGDELWAVFSLVDPTYRGQGIVAAIMKFAGQRLREEGFRFVYGHIAKGDMRAKAAHGRRGFRPIDVWVIYGLLSKTTFKSDRVRWRGRWGKARPLRLRIGDLLARGPGAGNVDLENKRSLALASSE